MDNEGLLIEIRDLLAEQNKLMTRIAEMNERAMAQNTKSLEYAANADSFVAKSKRQNGAIIWVFVAFMAVALALIWHGQSSTLKLLGL
ncbi:hypothetical protein [Pseudomonas sp. SO81]|uniref:hypothetical protein n=2 Tax=unclassified Pseudomonas TaxID=196821 RepID=UPI0025A3B32C|nr:hypothetical protein [Pseudomonas sp. SO81]WJN61117.1 hypothetical protein OH686_20420 [Pseudomonas sp. SO81]